jgi:hypothetical protein
LLAKMELEHKSLEEAGRESLAQIEPSKAYDERYAEKRILIKKALEFLENEGFGKAGNMDNPEKPQPGQGWEKQDLSQNRFLLNWIRVTTELTTLSTLAERKQPLKEQDEILANSDDEGLTAIAVYQAKLSRRSLADEMRKLWATRDLVRQGLGLPAVNNPPAKQAFFENLAELEKGSARKINRDLDEKQ